MRKKPVILALVGPTASGKTALSVRLAQKLNGEIISCDSMQVYCGMDIGTATPTYDEMGGVRHHLINIICAGETFSCNDYSAVARDAAADIISRDKLPIICGGTGLYLDAFIRGTDSPSQMKASGANLQYRNEMELLATKHGSEYIHNMLKEADPESAEKIHPNNLKRIIRALEIYHDTGMTKSEHDEISRHFDSPYDVCIIGLRYINRELLYKKIEKRVDLMIENGLVDEIKKLDKAGVFTKSSTAAQAIGYKEMLGYVRGELPLEVCVDEMKKATRRYAKRQMTWFGRYDNIKWIDVDAVNIQTSKALTFEDIVNITEKLFAEFLSCDIIKQDISLQHSSLP